MRAILKNILLLLSTLLVLGCASVVSGDGQYVTVNVTCKGQKYPSYCVASNAKGAWNFYTPEMKYILRDSTPLRVTCRSPSIGNYGVLQPASINITVAGNIIAGGLVGTAVDASRGSIWSYPQEISLESEFCKRLPA